jgi:hypothetical protein
MDRWHETRSNHAGTQNEGPFEICYGQQFSLTPEARFVVIIGSPRLLTAPGTKINSSNLQRLTFTREGTDAGWPITWPSGVVDWRLVLASMLKPSCWNMRPVTATLASLRDR